MKRPPQSESPAVPYHVDTRSADKPRLVWVGDIDISQDQELNDAGYSTEQFGQNAAFGVVLGDGWQEEISSWDDFVLDAYSDLPYARAAAWVYGDPKEGSPLRKHVLEL